MAVLRKFLWLQGWAFPHVAHDYLSNTIFTLFQTWEQHIVNVLSVMKQEYDLKGIHSLCFSLAI